VYGQRLAWDLRTQLWRIEGGRHFTPEDYPERLAAASNEAWAPPPRAVGAGLDPEISAAGRKRAAWNRARTQSRVAGARP
jgi:hypothetical protein